VAAVTVAIWAGSVAGAAGLWAIRRFIVRKRACAAKIDIPRAPAATLPAGDDRARLDYPNAEIWIRVTSDMERRHRARSCKKEPWTVQWLEQHVQSGDVVYDIGANVGTFTLIAAIARGARVVAFEPGYANFARLCENIFLNGCSDRVVPVPLPLSDANGLVRFVYRSVEPGQSRHRMDVQPEKDGRRPADRHADQAMCAIRLDDARAHFTLPPPSHIKLDVDGAELRVLRGAIDTLRLGTLRSVLIEVDGRLWTTVEALLTASGFHLQRKIPRKDAPTYAVFARLAPP
jgi:FkbM family methyltransferase